MTCIELDLPTATETERQLIGALLLMPVAERDAAVSTMSSVWFTDPWHRRLFNVIVENRRRDFGAEMLAAMKAGDSEQDHSAWWIARLLCDRDGASISGRPQLWKSYAATLERVYAYRVRIILCSEQLQDLINAARTETYAIHESASRNAEAHGGTARA